MLSILPPLKQIRRALAFFIAVFGYNRFVFREAKRTAREAKKPLLNAGCKSRYTASSDVNLDIVPRNVPNFVLGDIQKMGMFRDKQFGAVYASHVLEHVDNPDAAIKELERVAEDVFIITPLPIYPWAWLHPQHKWIFLGKKKLCRIPRPGKNGNHHEKA